MSETISCSAFIGGLEQALPSLTGVEFKLLFFLSSRSRFGKVVERIAAIARAIGVNRESITIAFKELLKMGLVSGRLGEANVILPEGAEQAEEQTTNRPSEDYVTLWDHLRTFQKTIREPLNDWVVQKCLEIGRAWGAASGREVSAVLHRAYRWLQIKAGKVEPPRKWIYIINGIRTQCERDANERKMEQLETRREEAERRPAPINVRKLAPTAGPAIDVSDLAQKKSLQRAVGAS